MLATNEPQDLTHSISVREIRAPYDKYASLRSSKPIKGEKEMSWSDMFYEVAFGEVEPTDFERRVSRW